MKLIRLIRYKKHVIKIYNNGMTQFGKPHFQYEWKIRGPRKINDPTSCNYISDCIPDAKEVVDYYSRIKSKKDIQRLR